MKRLISWVRRNLAAALLYLSRIIREEQPQGPSVAEAIRAIAGYWNKTGGKRLIRVNLKNLITDLQGVVVDVDETLVFIERFQLDAWMFALEKLVRHDRKVHSAFPEQRLEELRNIVRRAFHLSYFKEMLEKLRLGLTIHEWLPEDIFAREEQDRQNGLSQRDLVARTCLELEEISIKYRLEFMKKKIDEVGAKNLILPGVLEFLQECFFLGIKVGLYTNTPRAISEELLRYIFGAALDQLIPPAHRVYGDEVEVRKPNPEGRYKACEMMGLKPEVVAIIDDRATAVLEALKKNGRPGFGRGVVIAGLFATDEDHRRINLDMGSGLGETRYAVVNVLGEVGVSE